MKYLKYFKTDVDYQNYFNSDDFVTPNVSYVEDTNIVYYKPIKRATSTIFATYSATDDNKLAIANTSNVKSLKVNGNNVSFGNAYYFESNGEYEVEIELIDDSVITGAIYEDGFALSSSMFWDSENDIGSCLTSIIIPNSVTSIGDDAFDSCSSLTSINIPDSVTSIGRRAFSYCSSLTSITIPNSVTSIGRRAFRNCSSLTSITIPNSVTSIGDGAFYGCGSLPVENNLRYVGTYLVEVADKSLSTYTIKEGTKWIGEEAFDSCTGLTSITIPDSVTSIEEYAFYSCSNLNKITCLATTAPSIMSNTFEEIKSNGLLKIPAGSDYSSWMSTGDFYLGKYNWHIFTGDDLIIMTKESNPEVMKVCHNQGWAASPDEMYASEAATVTSIGTAFESLGEGSSSGDSGSNISFTFSFDEFKYFNGVTSIVNGAFYKSNIVSITIPDSVTSIEWRAFSNCSSLTSITIPDSVTSIRGDAFDGCDSLPVENNLRYADRCLVGPVDKSLSTYTIKEGTKWIKEEAFMSCTGLTSITIPNSVTSIGEYAFYGCSSLSSITIPNSITSIGESVFGSCSILTSITIPNSVTSIGNEAFSRCSSLSSITIPNSVTSIGSSVFSYCSKLNEITCLATTAPRIDMFTFEEIKSNGLLKIPAGSNYSSWMKTSNYYLGHYNWRTQEI